MKRILLLTLIIIASRSFSEERAIMRLDYCIEAATEVLDGLSNAPQGFDPEILTYSFTGKQNFELLVRVSELLSQSDLNAVIPIIQDEVLLLDKQNTLVFDLVSGLQQGENSVTLQSEFIQSCIRLGSSILVDDITPFSSRQTPAEEIELIIERKLKESGQLPTEEETTTFVTTYYEFPDKFTTKLLNSRKFLQMGLSISTQYDSSVIENVEIHTQALRSEILTVMGEFSEESIQGKAGRNELSRRIKETINSKLEELEGFGGIEGIYFSTFVLQ